MCSCSVQAQLAPVRRVTQHLIWMDQFMPSKIIIRQNLCHLIPFTQEPNLFCIFCQDSIHSNHDRFRNMNHCYKTQASTPESDRAGTLLETNSAGVAPQSLMDYSTLYESEMLGPMHGYTCDFKSRERIMFRGLVKERSQLWGIRKAPKQAAKWSAKWLAQVG